MSSAFRFFSYIFSAAHMYMIIMYILVTVEGGVGHNTMNGVNMTVVEWGWSGGWG